jgi:hypothetical protein
VLLLLRVLLLLQVVQQVQLRRAWQVQLQEVLLLLLAVLPAAAPAKLAAILQLLHGI